MGLVASLPGLAVGFLHDDLLQRLSLEGRLPDYQPGPFRLFDFTWGGESQVAHMMAEGQLPWVADPDLALRFFRPLSSLTLAIDAQLFGRNALAAHLHSLAWFLLLLATAGALLRRWLAPRDAWWASLVYALASGHAMTTAWLSARHGLVGASFGALALLAHARRRDEGWRPGAWLAPLALVAGLLSSEVALGAVAFWAIDEAVARRGPARERARAALPALAIAAAYLVFYGLARYGTRHSGAYVSPFDAPLAFAGAVLVRVPILLGEIYAALPSIVAASFDAAERPLAILGALSAIGVALALRARRDDFDPDRRRRLLALGLSTVGALLPAAGGIVGGRVLPLAAIGGAALVGAFLAGVVDRVRSSRGAPRLGWGALAALAFFLHFGLSPLVRLAMPLAFRQNAEDERKFADTAEVDGCPAGGNAYILTGSDPVNSLYAAPALLFYRPERAARLRQFRVLSMAPNDHRLRGVGGG
ncbi:MAG TPA: hypothetical protein VFS00_18490, partial [Polyangiaceae bacterium]|nr:hypothetical protein [Polyangiaceae bacterium]